MTFEEKIKSVVDTLTGSPDFMPAEDLFYLNQRIEGNHYFPLVAILPAGTGNVSWKTQVLKEPYIALWFAEKCEVDVAYSVKREIWERMFRLGAEFLIKAGKTSHFFPATDVTYEEHFDRFDVNTCGVTFFFRMKERFGLNVCDLEKLPEDET